VILRRRHGSPGAPIDLTIFSPAFASPGGGFFTAGSHASRVREQVIRGALISTSFRTASWARSNSSCHQIRGIQVVCFTARGLRIVFTQSLLSFGHRSSGSARASSRSKPFVLWHA
jgi:hypothetical protein